MYIFLDVALYVNMYLIIRLVLLDSDMGVQLFLDIVRSVSPTHIIRLLPSESSHIDTRKTLPPLTETLFTSTAGLFTTADKGRGTFVPVHKGYSMPMPGDSGSGTLGEVGPDSQAPCNSVSAENDRGTGQVCSATVDRDSSSDIEIFGSSEEAFDISGTR